MYSKLIILFGAVIAVALAAPVENTSPIAILKQSQDGPNPDGSYSWGYETENGISAQEQGQLNNVGLENEGMAVKGSYSYTDPDGRLVSINYIADENGYQPQGDVIPTPHPIPEAILRALDYIAKHPYVESKNDIA